MYSKNTSQAIFELVEYLRKPGGNPKHSKATEIVCEWWFPSDSLTNHQLSLIQALTMLLNLTLHKINYSSDHNLEVSEYYQQVHEFLSQLSN